MVSASAIEEPFALMGRLMNQLHFCGYQNQRFRPALTKEDGRSAYDNASRRTNIGSNDAAEHLTGL
jgi:hypothetical protein